MPMVSMQTAPIHWVQLINPRPINIAAGTNVPATVTCWTCFYLEIILFSELQLQTLSRAR